MPGGRLPPGASARLLPEWAPQDAVLLAWPHAESDWRELMPGVEADFVHLAAAVLTYESLIVLVRDGAHRRHIQSLLAPGRPAHPARFVTIETDDTWCRDFGPLAVARDGGITILDFQFNAWGDRYPWRRDNDVTRRLSQAGLFRAPVERRDFVLEGGSIESDGRGSILTTESCLLQGARNPALADASRETIAAALGQHLPLRRVMWLRHGMLAGDDTDGHIDNLARFTDTHTIAYTTCDDQNDEHDAPLRAMYEELRRFRRADGEGYRLVALPLPPPLHSRLDGHRLPASYANFLIINGAVLVPQFGVETDALARARLQDCFPDRAIIGIESRRFVEQNGGIHCLTMHMPAGTVNFDQPEQTHD